ncbi:MAG: radical SAM protein [DPANN group archaeon]|nr:radical SAM protein [DPANN group archaeon]
MKKSFYPKFMLKLLTTRAFKQIGYPKQVPYKLTFVVTNKCNSHCETCFIWDIYRQDVTKLKDELKTEEFTKILDSMKNDLFWLNITGGEPTMRTDLPDIVKYASDNCKNLGMINFPCNGIVPRIVIDSYTKIIESVRSDIDVYVTLSLDGPKEVHDKVRGTAGNYDSVMACFEGLKKLEEKHKNFHINFQATVSKLNIDSIKGHIDDIYKLADFNIITFAQEAYLFKNKNKSITIVGQDTYKKKLVDAIHYALEKIKVDTPQKVIQKIYLKLAIEFLQTGKLPIACSSSFATVTVDPYGEVTPCPFMGTSVGNLKNYNYNMKQVMYDHEAVKLQNQLRKGKCPECWMNCEAYPSIFDQFLPAMIKYAT